MRPVIRPANRNDVPALIAVFQDAVRHTCCADYTPEQIDVWVSRGTPARFGELFDSGLHFLIAESGAACAGYAAVSAQGELHSLFVAPAFQRQGLAGMLLDAARCCACDDGAQYLYAEVSISALPFFQQAGFSVVSEQQVVIGNTCFTNYRMQRTV